MEDRPAFSHQQASSAGVRSLTSLNPIARAAALTAQASEPSSPAPTPTPAPTAASPAPAPSTDAPAPEPAPAQPAAPTTTASVGKLAHVDAGRLWADGVAFAGWLAHNLDALGEALSVHLRDGRMPHAESPLVLASDESGSDAVIVCELGEATDEGFGRLVRNVAASKAKHAVWICGEPGDEYGASVSWLNRAGDARVSMVKVSGVTIGESAAAPMFEVRVRTPREADDGVEASVPSAAGTQAVQPARRADDWLDNVGAAEDAS